MLVCTLLIFVVTYYVERFAATQAGTFWYHSHLGMQKLDGFFGAVIVHDPTMPSYPSFFLLVNDFVHMDATEFALNFAPVMHVENKPKCKCRILL